MLKETHHVARSGLGGVVVGQHDHRGGTDETSVGLQGIEVQRDIAQRRRENSTRCAAREVTVKHVPILHAAAKLVAELADGNAGRRELYAGTLHTSRHRKASEALAPVAALGRK